MSHLDDRGIAGFTEKPSLGYDVSMGIYAMSRSILRRYPVGESFGFDGLILDLLENGPAPRSHPFERYWRDIGRPEDYDEANAEFESMRSALLPPVSQVEFAQAVGLD